MNTELTAFMYIPQAFSPGILIAFVVAMLIGFWAQFRVKSQFNKFSQVFSRRGVTGADVARQMLDQRGLHHVKVIPTAGSLTDHYDPLSKTVALSEPVYHSSSLAAIGVAAHECGHAIQHQANYTPLYARSALVKVQAVISPLFMIIPMLSMFLFTIAPKTALLTMCLLMGLLMLFNLVTLPVEFDATRRAKIALKDMGFVADEQEASGVSSVLTAAAWTYVAAFLTSMISFLQYLLPLLGGSRSSDE
jgi:uncharacterized protein